MEKRMKTKGIPWTEVGIVLVILALMVAVFIVGAELRRLIG
jgi:hypothetical protein